MILKGHADPLLQCGDLNDVGRGRGVRHLEIDGLVIQQACSRDRSAAVLWK